MRLPRKSALVPLAVFAALALAGCKAKVDIKGDARDEDSGNVQLSMGEAGTGNSGGSVSIDTPVFKADVKLPKMSFGGEHMDLDGIKLYPGSTVTGVNVDAQDRPGKDADRGVVRIAFRSDAAPAALVDYYAKSARDNGFEGVTAAGATVRATKTEDGKPKQFDLAVSPAGAGSTGSITLTGE